MELKIKHDHGFFSNCSMALYEINNFIKENNLNPELDMSKSFSWYKDANGEIDVYKLCFSQSFAKQGINTFEFEPSQHDNNLHLKRNRGGKKFKRHDSFYMSHRMYTNTFIQSTLPIVKRYFSPSEYILNLKEQYIQKYSISTKNTLAICYRGTDKKRELPTLDFNLYTDYSKGVLNKNKNLTNVLVQSDQSQFVNFCKDELSGWNVFQINEIPTTSSDKQISFTTSKKQDLATNFLASLLIISKCNFVINHTGNVGMWISLYRENCNQMKQFFL